MLIAASPSSKRRPERLRAKVDGSRGDAVAEFNVNAERIESRAAWADLRLRAEQMAMLRDLCRQARDGFTRGRGVAALFVGERGAVTTAAEVIAGELECDLLRIDLSRLVSKWIGETEKNLSRVFDAAEDAGAVLLFDEADALFGERGEAKGGHDRFANLDVDGLVEQLESHQGVAILASNRSTNVEHALRRRIRFVVEFPDQETSSV